MLSRLIAALIVLSAIQAGSAAHAEGKLRLVEQFGTLSAAARDPRPGADREAWQAAGHRHHGRMGQAQRRRRHQRCAAVRLHRYRRPGIGPVLTIWDRTKGNADIKVIAALGRLPNFLVTRNPNVKSLKDFTKADKIAVPAVGRLGAVAHVADRGREGVRRRQARRARRHHRHARPSRRDGALLSGGDEITAHFSNPPFQEQALQKRQGAQGAELLRHAGRPDHVRHPQCDGQVPRRKSQDLQGFGRALKEAVRVDQTPTRPKRQKPTSASRNRSSIQLDPCNRSSTDTDVSFTS